MVNISDGAKNVNEAMILASKSPISTEDNNFINNDIVKSRDSEAINTLQDLGVIVASTDNSSQNEPIVEPTPTPKPTVEPTPTPEPTSSGGGGSSSSSSSNSDSSSSKTTEKNVADGYIIKLSTPAKAYCKDANYTTSTIGAKGLITFSDVELSNDCLIHIEKGAIIDSNNNRKIDNNDKNLTFDMKGYANGRYISPLTTLLIIKKEKGEDVSDFEKLVLNFDPVESASLINQKSGAKKTEIQKLLTLTELLKNSISDQNISISELGDINLSSITSTAVNESISDFDITKLTSSISNSTIKNKLEAKIKTMASILELFDTLDSSKVDLSTLFVNISDGGKNIKESIISSLHSGVKLTDNNSLDSIISDIIIENSNMTPSIKSEIINNFNILDGYINNMKDGNFSNISRIFSHNFLSSLFAKNFIESDNIIKFGTQSVDIIDNKFTTSFPAVQNLDDFLKVSLFDTLPEEDFPADKFTIIFNIENKADTTDYVNLKIIDGNISRVNGQLHTGFNRDTNISIKDSHNGMLTKYTKSLKKNFAYNGFYIDIYALLSSLNDSDINSGLDRMRGYFNTAGKGYTVSIQIINSKNTQTIKGDMYIVGRKLQFTNLNRIKKVQKVLSLNSIFNGYNGNVHTKNYDTKYEKMNSTDEESFSIQTNYISRFEIVQGRDSKFFEISKGNRNIAYIALKDDMESPTPDNPQDYNHDGIYEVEVKATDVQMLESKSIILGFEVTKNLIASAKADIISPITTKRGFISKFGVPKGMVVNDKNDGYCYNNHNDTNDYCYRVIDTGNLEVNSIRLGGNSSDDFEIIDNSKLKLKNSPDYDTRPIYNLKVIATTVDGSEYSQDLTIEVINDSSDTIEFRDRANLEKTFEIATLLKYQTNQSLLDTIHIALDGNYNSGEGNYNIAKFEIIDELDSKFFRVDTSHIGSYNWLYSSSLNPSYKTAEDANGDGIYEVKVKATDIQTLKSSILHLKFKLVSHKVFFYNQNYNSYDYNSYDYKYSVSENTVIGGEVPYSAFYINKAKDINITDIHLEGDRHKDFNISNNTITVAQTLDSATKSSYNLTIVSTDTANNTYEQNITININSGESHNALEITNPVPTSRFTVNWNDFRDSDYINTNYLTYGKISGVDASFFRMFTKGRHSTYWDFDKRFYNNEEEITYKNPKDDNQDNIYEIIVTVMDIQNLQTKSMNFTYHMLSHQVQPYLINNSDTYQHDNNLVINLTIPPNAPIGGELLTNDGTKGFYIAFGKDIQLNTISLEGSDAEKFELSNNNTIKLKQSLAIGTYEFDVTVTDNQGNSSTHHVNVKVH
jgi:hypothetical protein